MRTPASHHFTSQYDLSIDMQEPVSNNLINDAYNGGRPAIN